MRFETDQTSEQHRGFLLEFNTDFKAVISYLFRLRLLILQARYNHCNKNDIQYMVFRSPKWQFQTQGRHKIVRISTA